MDKARMTLIEVKEIDRKNQKLVRKKSNEHFVSTKTFLTFYYKYVRKFLTFYHTQVKRKNIKTRSF